MTFTTDHRVVDYRNAVTDSAPMSVRIAAEAGFVTYMLESAPAHMHPTVLRVLAREGFSRDALRSGGKLTDDHVAQLPPPDAPDGDPAAPLRAMPYTEYLQTHHWQLTREQALYRAQNRCQVCNAKDHLEVHHRTYERRGEELAEDLIVLCNACHGLFHEASAAA